MLTAAAAQHAISLRFFNPFATLDFAQRILKADPPSSAPYLFDGFSIPPLTIQLPIGFVSPPCRRPPSKKKEEEGKLVFPAAEEENKRKEGRADKVIRVPGKREEKRVQIVILLCLLKGDKTEITTTSSAKFCGEISLRDAIKPLQLRHNFFLHFQAFAGPARM